MSLPSVWHATLPHAVYVDGNEFEDQSDLDTTGPHDMRIELKWNAYESDTEVLFGTYVQAKVGVQVTRRLSVSAFARYDWSQGLDAEVGPSSFDANLDGLSAGVMVGFTF